MKSFINNKTFEVSKETLFLEFHSMSKLNFLLVLTLLLNNQILKIIMHFTIICLRIPMFLINININIQYTANDPSNGFNKI